MPKSTTDRNLLFGILALQMDFIARDALIVAMNAWVLEKAKPLGQILLEQKALTADTHALLEALVQKHLALHGNDAEKSLAAINSVGSVRNDLQQIADPDVQASLVHVAADPFATVAPPSVGAPTSGGLRFRILRPHAKGGLGEVSVALDEELHREVALKEIQNKHADHPESRARFLLEAEITGGLEHPGIVPVYGLGTYADGRPFYAMRFIRGDSLQDAIKRFHQSPGTAVPGLSAGERTLELRKLLGRLIDVCNALQYAHDRGVLHRDIKPGNIMLGKYGETLVVDWGLAKASGKKSEPEALAKSHAEPPLQPASASGSAETVAGSAIGTPAYMSPEQAEGRLDLLGPASDVYSLGATLYTLLTGKTTVEGGDLNKVQRGDFPRPRQLKPDADVALEAICLKAMALDQADRYASPNALAGDIEHWLGDEPVGAWPEPVLTKAGRWARGHKPLVSGAAAALLVGMITGTAWLLWHQNEQNARQLEETERQADLKQKIIATEQEITFAMDQAEESRGEFRQILKKQGGVFRLLNEPEHWKAQIVLARRAVDRAKAVQKSMPINPVLSERIQALATLLDQDVVDRDMAVRLDKIRLDRVVGQFELDKDDLATKARAAREYLQAFAEAGFPVVDGEGQQVATRIGSSAIKEQLVAGLDDWAWIAHNIGNQELLDQLLLVARLADPDLAWGDKVRLSKTWKDCQQLADLAKRGPPPNMSRQMLSLVGYLLPSGPERESWLREAQARYPDDFWLSMSLGGELLWRNAVEADGSFRAALAVRPKNNFARYSIGLRHFTLGLNLQKDKKRLDAITAYKKAIEASPRNDRAYTALGDTLREETRLGFFTTRTHSVCVKFHAASRWSSSHWSMASSS